MSDAPAHRALADARFAALAALVDREFPAAPGLLLRGEPLVASLGSASALSPKGARAANATVALLPQLLAPEVWSATWFILLDDGAALSDGATLSDCVMSTRSLLMEAREALRRVAHPDSPDPESSLFRQRLAEAVERVAASGATTGNGEATSAGVPVGSTSAGTWDALLHRFRDRLETSRAFAAEVVSFAPGTATIKRIEGTAGDVSDAYGV